MRIFIHPYKLKVRQKLGALFTEASTREGVLIKTKLSNGEVGYADLCPIVEAGDDPLPTQLELIKKSTPSKLALCSLECARIDGAARSKEKSLFENLPIPPSHCLLTDWIRTLRPMAGKAQLQGFKTLKLKMSPQHLNEQADALNDLCNDRSIVLRLRLDFNAKIESQKILSEGFLARLNSATLDAIDFLEDPLPYSSTSWKELQATFGLRLALDRKLEGFLESAVEPDMNNLDAIDTLILKSATQFPERTVNYAKNHLKRLSVTSYMDHPLGQSYAAYVAATIYASDPLLIDECGLLTHHLFEPNAFSEEFQAQELKSPNFLPAKGFGLGFDAQLEALAWTKLC